MWYGLLIVVGLLVLSKIVQVSIVNRCWYLMFLGGAIWLRFFLSGFHEYTFSPILMGLSINAIVSIIVVVVGLLVIPVKYWSFNRMLVFYTFIIFLLLSSVLNAQYLQFIGVLTKWLYLLVIAMITYHVMMIHNKKRVILFLLIPFLLPMVMQMLSMILGFAKATEGAGAVSFIGGYNHEAVFSILVLSYLFLLCLLPKGGCSFHYPLIGYTLFVLVMVNYRTALLAAIPITLFFVWTRSISLVVKTQRVYMVSALLGFFSVIFFYSIIFFGERFADISVVINNFGELIKSDIYYTRSEQDLFSARLYFWSQYITKYLESDIIKLLFGFGPDAWKFYFDKYAHNTFVSYLFEFGVVGVSVFIYIIWSNFFLLLRSGGSSVLLSMHLGFVVLNLATMPLWQIEGIIFYGLILGFTWFEVVKPKCVIANGLKES